MYQDLPKINLVVETRCKSQFTHYCTNEYVLERSTKIMAKVIINSKKENQKIMEHLNVSEEKGKILVDLCKAFKAKNKEEQERICSELELPQGRTYGCWKNSNSFGEFIAKVYGKGEFLPLWEINSQSILGVFKKSPVWDDERGWIFPQYIQVKDLKHGRYIPIQKVLYLLKKEDRELPESVMEFLYDSITKTGYIHLDGEALEILGMATYAGVLPQLEEGDPLKEVIHDLWAGGYTTPPAMGDERYDNAIEPDVWEQDWDAYFERDMYSPSLEKVLRSLQYLESSSLPKAKEVKSLYWNKEGLNIKLLWRDLQQRGYAETLCWEGWEEDPDKGSYEEKTLWSLKALRSLTKEELQTLLQMKEDTLLTQVGYASLQTNPCKVYKVDPKTLQGRKKHEYTAHVKIPW